MKLEFFWEWSGAKKSRIIIIQNLIAHMLNDHLSVARYVHTCVSGYIYTNKAELQYFLLIIDKIIILFVNLFFLK